MQSSKIYNYLTLTIKDARKAKMAKVADIIKTPFKVLKAKTDEIKESIKKSREERAKKISARTPFER